MVVSLGLGEIVSSSLEHDVNSSTVATIKGSKNLCKVVIIVRFLIHNFDAKIDRKYTSIVLNYNLKRTKEDKSCIGLHPSPRGYPLYFFKVGIEHTFGIEPAIIGQSKNGQM